MPEFASSYRKVRGNGFQIAIDDATTNNNQGDQMKKSTVKTNDAPKPIGPYSQAIRVSGGDTVYLSGQIGLHPSTMQMAAGVEEQAEQVFSNLMAVAAASGGGLNDIVKLN